MPSDEEFERCIFCNKKFKKGKGYDKKDFYCSECCYEQAKREGWME